MKPLSSIPMIHCCLHVLLAALLAFSLTSCLTLESVSCNEELSCRGGMTCAAADDVCISAMSPSCGNGVIEAGEACDDGNVRDNDRCSASCKSDETCGNGVVDVTVGEVCDTRAPENGGRCSPDCRSLQGCGNLYLDPGEECDDGNDSNDDDCLSTCQLARCGDGYTASDGALKEECDPRNDPTGCDLDCTPRLCGDRTINAAAGEECEPPGKHKDFFCTSACKISRCGDGVIDGEAGEVCDDGNTLTESECPYGSASCTPCSADCKATLTLPRGTFCGDGVRNGPERCDDGNTLSEEECPYGTASCTLCSNDCMRELPLTGDYCGDGDTNGPEVCDDGNADACGSCNADCTETQLRHATGSISAVAGDAIKNNVELHISDGSRTAKLTISPTGSNESSKGYRRIRVFDSDSATDVARMIRDAIQSLSQHELAITATRDGTTVNLQHKEPGAHGNRIIARDPGSHPIHANGMTGGKGRNCPDTMACNDDHDCEPHLICHPTLKLCGMYSRE